MAKTWELLSTYCGNDDNVQFVIEELEDDVVINTYRSDRFHKSTDIDKFKQSLKEKILKHRAKIIEETAAAGKLDLENFETYLNS